MTVTYRVYKNHIRLQESYLCSDLLDSFFSKKHLLLCVIFLQPFSSYIGYNN